MERVVKRLGLVPALVLVVPGAGGLEAQVPVERQFALALELLPEDARDGAELRVRDGGGYDVYREGAGRFVCVADASDASRISVGCFHQSLEAFQAWETKLAVAGLRGADYRARLCRDVEAGRVAVPDRGYSLSLSGTIPEGRQRPDSVTVYHFLQLPYATEESTGLPEEELVPGQPWLHHAGACSAHLMWSETRVIPPSRVWHPLEPGASVRTEGGPSGRFPWSTRRTADRPTGVCTPDRPRGR